MKYAIVILCLLVSISNAGELPDYWKTRTPSVGHYLVEELYYTGVKIDTTWGGLIVVGVVCKKYIPKVVIGSPALYIVYWLMPYYQVGDTVAFLIKDAVYKEQRLIVPEESIKWNHLSDTLSVVY